MKKVLLSVFSVLFAFSSYAQQQENVELTIYNQNFALVKDQRNFALKKGLNKIDFREVAALIEPTSVHFVSLTEPASCVILEQNYEYDLVNSNKLLFKYLDKNIKVVTTDEKLYEGKLLNADENNIVIASGDGLHLIGRKDNIRQIGFEKLPEGLITKPTLIWEIDNLKEGRHLTEVSYLTGGVNWYCEYVTVLDKDDKNIDLDGWVSIDNKSGASYKDAKLKLIAGEVKRAAPEYKHKVARDAMVFESAKANAPQFEEKAFFEYHMYTLQRKTTVKDNQTKQISLLNARQAPVKKELIFDASKGKNHYLYYSDNETIKENARVELVFKNSKENNLGMPLPKGKIKVYKKDQDGSLQFIGEDAIEHTPKDEEIRLYIGDAFDVVGERKRANFKHEYRTARETYEISLRNHKKEDIEIIVSEKLWRYSNWEIENASGKWDKKDASTIEFKVKVPKDSEAKVSYTVRYWW